jgi:DNA-binding MarR family transcriptional regulator
MMREGVTPTGTDRLWASPLAGDVSFLLARANALSLASGNGALAPFDLKVRSFSVLALASSGANPSQRDLAEFLRLDPSQVVALVDALQERGLVERRPDPRDRRANVVVATEAGRTLWAAADAAARASERTLHAGITDEERESLTDLLRRIASVEV